ncbi:WXG100 family type VII secretion target [Paractinoplanes brasiliensis]|uniref:Excreted virulence factor EspC (Type VII ESX diderm) n=1 Tax=Paractinoplanes brasiliensis TaxID=52695 RepID=A0A4R6JVF4_9ACTN|nr:type VII secretion target [Actinoplanes brasiliensis]TDO39531.1 excreted virulence factor EspC (type VII ESX diderm) [Actinoplanes brasiliensis]GID29130.1 hypothetical protein Abr02nite_41130 [Actinoplanes brasiliensis]
MTFRVEPGSLRLYAAELADASGVAEATQNYANKWGSLTPHQLGILGQVTQRHENFMEDLNETLLKLAKVLDTSSVNLRSVAATYERTDSESAAQIDSSYPTVQRPITSAGS